MELEKLLAGTGPKSSKDGTPAIDFREGERFYKTAAEVKAALRSQINDTLKVGLNAYMTEVKQELEPLSPEASAALFLAVMMDEELSPKAMLVRQCLQQAVIHSREIEQLTYIYNNIHPGFMYQLSLPQLIKYGMIPKGEAV